MDELGRELSSTPELPEVAEREPQKPVRAFDSEEFMREHNLRMIQPAKIEFRAEEYDLDKLSAFGLDSHMVAELLSYFIKYLNTPIIIDNFGNDPETRHDLGDEAYRLYYTAGSSFLGNNKLKNNKATAPYAIIEHVIAVLSRGVGPNSNEILDAFLRMKKEFSWMKKYKEIPHDDEKLARLEEADRMFLDLLEMYKKKQ